MNMLDFPDHLRVCSCCKNWSFEANSFGKCSVWSEHNEVCGQMKALTREDGNCSEFDPEPEALEEAEKWLEDARYDDEALGLVRGVDYPFSL